MFVCLLRKMSLIRGFPTIFDNFEFQNPESAPSTVTLPFSSEKEPLLPLFQTWRWLIFDEQQLSRGECVIIIIPSIVCMRELKTCENWHPLVRACGCVTRGGSLPVSVSTPAARVQKLLPLFVLVLRVGAAPMSIYPSSPRSVRHVSFPPFPKFPAQLPVSGPLARSHVLVLVRKWVFLLHATSPLRGWEITPFWQIKSNHEEFQTVLL